MDSCRLNTFSTISCTFSGCLQSTNHNSEFQVMTFFYPREYYRWKCTFKWFISFNFFIFTLTTLFTVVNFITTFQLISLSDLEFTLPAQVGWKVIFMFIFIFWLTIFQKRSADPVSALFCFWPIMSNSFCCKNSLIFSVWSNLDRFPNVFKMQFKRFVYWYIGWWNPATSTVGAFTCSARGSCMEVSYKKGVRRNFANSQGNTCARASFLINFREI